MLRREPPVKMSAGQGRRKRRLPYRWHHLLLAFILLVLFVFPFYWVIVTSLNSANQVLQFPPVFLPHGHWINYVEAWVGTPWLRFFANTVFIAATTTVLVLITSILAGFALGTLSFPGKKALFAGLLSMMMIPQMVLIIPDYVILQDFHWINTYQAQIIPWGASVFGIFLLRQFFLSLPLELREASELDGASNFRYLWQIAVPMAKPILITVALYIFIGSWNSFLWPFIMTTSPSVQPIEVGLATFLGTNGTDWTGLSAAVVFTTLPVMILFLVAQRQFMAGAYASASGVKG